MKTRPLKDWSAIDKHIKIKDVLKEMVEFVINREVEKDPFIAWLSIGQIQHGKQDHIR